MATDGRVYLDSSAIVKLAVEEVGSIELRAYLHGCDRWSSELALAEVSRALIDDDLNSPERARRAATFVLSRFGLIGLDRPTLMLAGRLPGSGLRTLDALHVASALRFGHTLRAFVTYDARQAVAASRAGLNVVGPGSA